MTDKPSKKNGPGKKLKGEPLKNSIKSTLRDKPAQHKLRSEKRVKKPTATDSLAVHMYRANPKTVAAPIAKAAEKKFGKIDLKKYKPNPNSGSINWANAFGKLKK